jgi:hypothetical protein
MSTEASFFSRLPFRRRTWIRMRLPWWLIDRNVAGYRNGDDCERRGAHHEWYNCDNRNSGCCHCGAIKEGRLWKGAERK